MSHLRHGGGGTITRWKLRLSVIFWKFPKSHFAQPINLTAINNGYELTKTVVRTTAGQVWTWANSEKSWYMRVAVCQSNPTNKLN